MTPFFAVAATRSLNARVPLWLLWMLSCVFAFEAVASVVEALDLARAGGWPLLRACVELPVGAACLLLSVQWAFVQNLRARMLAMLHVGFTWLGASLVMFGVSSAAAFAANGPGFMGLAPLHAFTMGYLGSTLFAVVTRVASGHSGRSQAADDFTWRLFWVLQLAILARLAAALLPALPVAPLLLGASAVAWATACCAWAVRHVHWFGTPRVVGITLRVVS
jgi:uncharacterized protein involved in response to NO